MPKTSDTSIYSYDSDVSLEDYFFGTDKSKKSKSYKVKDLASFLKTMFSEEDNLSFAPMQLKYLEGNLADSGFISNSQLNIGDTTEITISNKNGNGTDLSVLLEFVKVHYEKLQINIKDFLNPNFLSYYNITSIEDVEQTDSEGVASVVGYRLVVEVSDNLFTEQVFEADKTYNILFSKANASTDDSTNRTSVKSNEVFLSDFGGKNDLKYIDIEFNTANQIICPLDPFTDADIGKLIAIKNTHHNPNTADGTEYPNSQLGRIVTVTTKITAVNSGVATIDFSCNLTANARAYSYTNNFDALQDAINYAQENQIETIVRDGDGIYGINPLFSEKYPNSIAAVVSNTWHLSIIGDNENPIKLCVEDTTVERNWFEVKQGNYSFILDGKLLPPDRYSTTFALTSTVISTNWNNEYAGNSARNITLKNIGKVDKTDTDGNDSWFCNLIRNSRGGFNNTDKKQKITIDNVDVRLLYGGFSSFSQNGNFNTLYHKDWNWKRWGNHYLGEVGKEFATTFEELNSDEMESWTFNSRDDDSNIIGQTLNFTVNSGVLTMDDLSSNFSFYDYRTASILAALRKVYVRVSGVNYEITNVINAKSVDVTGLADGNYTDEWGVETGYGSFGHPVYNHHNQKMYFINCVGDVDEVKLASGSALPNETNNEIEFINCDINRVYFQSANYKPNVYTEGSIIENLVLICNKLTTKNSKLKLNGSVSYIESLGGNHFLSGTNYLASGCLVKEENDFYSYDDILDFSYLDFEKESRVTFDNWSISEDGTGRVGFYKENSIVTYKNSKSKTAFAFESIGRHSNFYAYYINNKITEPLYRTSVLFNYTFHPSTITDKVFFQDSIISFNNGRYNLDPSQSIYLEVEPVNKVDVSKIYKLKGQYNSVVAIQYRYQNTSFGFNRDTWNIDLGLDFNKSNYFKLVDQTNQSWIPRGLAVVALNSSNSIFSRGVGLGCLSHNSLFEGYVYIEITNPNQLNVLESKMNYYDGRNVTNNNILLKGLERKVGEVLKFELLPNGFLKEVSSTNEEKTYVSTIPTRKGIQGEKLWLNSDVSYQYDINTNLLTDEVLTVSLVEGIPFEHNGFTEAYTIDTGKVFTIGQNFSDGNITPFTFKIVLDDNTELSFDNVGLHNNPSSTTDELPNLVRSAWLYKANDGTNVYCAYVDNLSGKIVILKNHTITLKATDNLIINGLEVVSEKWYRNYEKQGVELLTTTERNAILSECREGYEVVDTDLNQRVTKVNNAWL